MDGPGQQQRCGNEWPCRAGQRRAQPQQDQGCGCQRQHDLYRPAAAPTPQPDRFRKQHRQDDIDRPARGEELFQVQPNGAFSRTTARFSSPAIVTQTR